MDVFTGSHGLEDLARDLADLPQRIVQDLFPDALAAGGAVVERDLRARTPVAEAETTSAKQYGRLVDDLSTHVEIDGELTGNAKTGFDKLGFVAVFLEYGHRSGDGKFTAANSFIRQAAEASEDAAVEAFTDSIADNIGI
jgi:hypothetical protein